MTTKKVKKMAFGGLGSMPTQSAMQARQARPAGLGGGAGLGLGAMAAPPPPMTQSAMRAAPPPPMTQSAMRAAPPPPMTQSAMRRPGMKKGGSVSSASKRADGIATKGKTRGKIV